MPVNPPITPWTPERIGTLTNLWIAGWTAGKIAQVLGGTTRNAVIGKAHRLKLAQGEPRLRPLPKTMPPKPAKSIRIEASRAARIHQPVKTKEAPALIGDIWAALPGSTPVPMSEMTGCKWPIGDRPMLFCNEPLDGDARYCSRHMPIGISIPQPSKHGRVSYAIRHKPHSA